MFTIFDRYDRLSAKQDGAGSTFQWRKEKERLTHFENLRKAGIRLYRSAEYGSSYKTYSTIINSKGLQNKSYHAYILGLRAASLVGLRRPEDALKDCDVALGMRPTMEKARVVRARAYLTLGMHSQAVNDLLNTTKNAASIPSSVNSTRARSSWENAIKEEKKKEQQKQYDRQRQKDRKRSRTSHTRATILAQSSWHKTSSDDSRSSYSITEVTVGNEGGQFPRHRRLPRGRSNVANRRGVRVGERVEEYHRHDTVMVAGQMKLQRRAAVRKITTTFLGYPNEPVRSQSKRLTAN